MAESEYQLGLGGEFAESEDFGTKEEPRDPETSSFQVSEGQSYLSEDFKGEK
ncbi:MAG: hypothetical protein Q8Q24_01570 [bacterium]|nr:hypothetical protein [bacterium]